ncbi:hypothetical protein V6N13_131980 [Hibiscus sabdariffa]|uniref:Uncharacterized protein n=1 Tax=Hibiscus sabdariffa TaxID=183260 RepID=A0ABR2NIZ7_9ROSI
MEATRLSSTKLVQTLKPKKMVSFNEDPMTKVSDALSLPLYLTNVVFFTLFFSVGYFLLSSWREKIRTSTPFHVVTLSEIIAILAFFTSFIYLMAFFGLDFVQSLIFRPSPDVWFSEDEEENEVLLCKEDARKVPCGQALNCSLPPLHAQAPIVSAQEVFKEKVVTILMEEYEEIIKSVVAGMIPSYSLESKLGDCKRSVAFRREIRRCADRRRKKKMWKKMMGFEFVPAPSDQASFPPISAPVLNIPTKLGLRTGTKIRLRFTVSRELPKPLGCDRYVVLRPYFDTIYSPNLGLRSFVQESAGFSHRKRVIII